jgi:hypothetical protein
MTRLVLEFHRDRRRASRLTSADWGRYWKADADALGTQVSEQIRHELEHRVNDIATGFRSTAASRQVHVTVDVVQRADENGRESTTGTCLAAAIAIVDAPIVDEQIRSVAETVAAWNRLYVLPPAGGNLVGATGIEPVTPTMSR